MSELIIEILTMLGIIGAIIGIIALLVYLVIVLICWSNYSPWNDETTIEIVEPRNW